VFVGLLFGSRFNKKSDIGSAVGTAVLENMLQEIETHTNKEINSSIFFIAYGMTVSEAGVGDSVIVSVITSVAVSVTIVAVGGIAVGILVGFTFVGVETIVFVGAITFGTYKICPARIRSDWSRQLPVLSCQTDIPVAILIENKLSPDRTVYGTHPGCTEQVVLTGVSVSPGVAVGNRGK